MRVGRFGGEFISQLPPHSTLMARHKRGPVGCHPDLRVSLAQEELENLQDAQNEVMMIMDDDPVKVTILPDESSLPCQPFPFTSTEIHPLVNLSTDVFMCPCCWL
jgi:hypothetical protein